MREHHRLVEDEDSKHTGSSDVSGPSKIFNRSTFVVVLVGVTSMIEYSMVMPSLSSYVLELGGSHVLYGVCVGLFSLARLFSMPLLGTWSDKRPMLEPLVFSILISALGNLLYGLAQWFDSAWFIVIARFVVGLGAGNAALSMAYVTRITTSKNRTQYLATINGLNLLGIVMGPALNVAVKSIEWKPFGESSGPQLNEKTNPGFFMVGILMFELLVCVCVFKEPEGSEESNESLDQTTTTTSFDQAISDIRRMVVRGAYVSYSLGIANNFTLAFFETALPVLTDRAFGWGVLENSVLYMSIGLSVAVDIVIMIILTRRGVKDRYLVYCGHCCVGVGLVMGMIFLESSKFTMFEFIGCFFFLIVPLPFVGNPNVSLYTKHIENEGLEHRTGFFMGVLLGVGGICRTLGPIWAGYGLGLSNNTVGLTGPLFFWIVAFVLLTTHTKYLRGPVKKKTLSCDDAENGDSSSHRRSNDLTDPLLSGDDIIKKDEG